MTTSCFSLVSYVLISSFTPGPSNISSASMAVLHGYKKTLQYQLGLAAGVFFFMFVSGWLSTMLLNLLPGLEPILRYVGAGYILYLAVGVLKASYTFNERDVKPLGFLHGLTLQILNPKLIVYAFTLYSAFLAPMTKNAALMVLVSVLLAGTSFCATSGWALFGAVVKTHLHDPRWKATVNIILSLLLVYTALTLVGVI